MTEVLTTLFAPIFVMLILIMGIERFIWACLMTADFVMRLLFEPTSPVRPISRR